MSGLEVAQDWPKRGRHFDRPATLDLTFLQALARSTKRIPNSCPFGTRGRGPGEHQHAEHTRQDAAFLVLGVCAFFLLWVAALLAHASHR